jgi:dUTP pyrophosphatase
MAELKVKRINQNAQLPKRGSVFAAGYDICASENMSINPQCIGIVPTGLQIAVPNGHYGRLASRSGLYTKNLISVGAGVIDSDYRGELKVVLHNFNTVAFDIKVGDRIAQLIIEVIATPIVSEVNELTDTERGSGGFGSTGVSQELKNDIPPNVEELNISMLCGACHTRLYHVEYISHKFVWKCSICQRMYASPEIASTPNIVLKYST